MGDSTTRGSASSGIKPWQPDAVGALRLAMKTSFNSGPLSHASLDARHHINQNDDYRYSCSAACKNFIHP